MAPYAFRSGLPGPGINTARVGFSGEPATGTTAAHLQAMPGSLHKPPATTNPRLWVTGALGAMAVAATAASVRRRGSADMGVQA
jgi:hypothetical protein